jgi:hypothetical protein
MEDVELYVNNSDIRMSNEFTPSKLNQPKEKA